MLVHYESMKRTFLLPLGATAALLASCGFPSPPNSQNFDPGLNPLDSPGRSKPIDTVDAGPRFTPGSYVEVTDANAGLYRRIPRGNAQPDYGLAMGTPLKVVGEQGSYVKVETESGRIGFVPAIMVSSKSRGPEVPIVPAGRGRAAPTSIEPIDSIDPIDPVAPTPLPESAPERGEGPFVAPDPEVPPISVEEAPAVKGPGGSSGPADPIDPTGPVIPLDPPGDE